MWLMLGQGTTTTAFLVEKLDTLPKIAHKDKEKEKEEPR
jgi:hypothetical protein